MGNTNSLTQKEPAALSEDTVKRMQATLDRLGAPLRVRWEPDSGKSIHGELKESCVFIYDRDEDQAWETLTHELLEFKLKEVTDAYRSLTNALIESYEKLCYRRKEQFLEGLPRVLTTIREMKSEACRPEEARSPDRAAR